MVIVWRSLLIFSLALIGLAAGTLIGGQFLMPQGQGLAAAPIALGYGLVGALGSLLIAIVLALKLPMIKLRNYALVGTLLASLIYGTLVYRAIVKSAALGEPDSALVPTVNLAAVMKRLDTSDPYLNIKMQ